MVKPSPVGGDILLDAPPEELAAKDSPAMITVWVTVTVPKDTKPGVYHGQVSVEADGATKRLIALSLAVADWTLPDPQNYRTWTDFIQSPDTLALEYNVPLWSEKHWELIAKSFRLLSPSGGRTLYVPLIARTNLGNEQSMVRWIKKGDKYEYDYTVLDRYLDTAEKNLGKPKLVIFWVWDLCMSMDKKRLESTLVNDNAVYKKSRDEVSGKGPRVTSWNPDTKESGTIFLPRYEEPESKALWQPMFTEVINRMKKRGLEKSMMLGMMSDVCPSMEDAVFWKDVSGNLPWVNQSHGGAGENGVAALHKIADVGYATQVYGVHYAISTEKEHRYGWQNPYSKATLVRWAMNVLSPTLMREIQAFQITGCQHGVGRLGGDIWPAIRNKKDSVLRDGMVYFRYPENNWRQLDIKDWFLAPGPDGAVATARLEYLKEGTQVCEARIFLEETLLDANKKARIGDELASRCQQALDAHHHAMWRALWSNDEDIRSLGPENKHYFFLNASPQSALVVALKNNGWRWPNLDKDGRVNGKTLHWEDEEKWLIAAREKGEAWFATGWQDREKKLFDLAGEVSRAMMTQKSMVQ